MPPLTTTQMKDAGLVTEAERVNKVEEPCIEYSRMAEGWLLLHDLLGGTRQMHKAGKRWLPKHKAEEEDVYKARLKMTVLFNAYGDTVKRLAGKPFSRPLIIKDEAGRMPSRLAMIEDDADGMGRTLSQLAQDMLEAGITYGKTHLFVDFTSVPPGATLADEQRMGARPNFVHVTANDLIGWRSVVIDSEHILTQIRIRETTTEPTGRYGDTEVHRVRVVNAPTPIVFNDGEVAMSPGTWELWRKVEDEDRYIMEDSGTHSFPGIPLVTAYLKRTGFMTADPPLENLAWLNLSHWQSSSDQRNILRFARLPLLFAKGWSKTESRDGVVAAPTSLISTTSAEADLKFVEHNGSAIKAGEDDLLKIEEKMQMMGMEPLLRRTGNRTATERAIEEAKIQTDIQVWVRNLEFALKNAYRTAAIWTGDEFPEEIEVDIFNDFGLSSRAQQDIESLVEARRNGDISRKTFITELKRHGVISDEVVVDEEISAVEKELEQNLRMAADTAVVGDDPTGGAE